MAEREDQQEYQLPDLVQKWTALRNEGIAVLLGEGSRTKESKSNVKRIELDLGKLSKTIMSLDPQQLLSPADDFKAGYYERDVLTIDDGRIVPTVESKAWLPKTASHSDIENIEKFGLKLVLIKQGRLHKK